MPSQAELQAVYEDGDLHRNYAERHGSAYVSGDFEALPYIHHRLIDIGRMVGGGRARILDIGAANGAFLAGARALGWEIEGVELSQTSSDMAYRHFGINLHTYSLHDAQFPAGWFDAVHMSHVLEHMPDPWATLLEIHRILRPGGVLAIEVPNEFNDLFGTLRSRLLGRHREPYAVPSPHTHFFTPATLKRLVEDTGFEVCHMETPRRDATEDSAFPFGGLVRRAVFAAERMLKRGPLIEVYARRNV